MMHLLVLGTAILAVGPFIVSADEIRAPDVIFPVATVEGWQVVSAVLPDDFSLELYEWRGELVAKVPQAEPVVVPQSVPRRQARQALLLAGVLAKVQPAIDAIADPMQRGVAQIYWDEEPAYERTNALLIQLGTMVGLDAAGIDALFIQAAAL